MLLSPCAVQAQSFTNVQGTAYRTTGSGSGTAFSTSLGSTNSSLDPTLAGGDYFNTNVSNFGLPPGTPFGAVWTGSFYAPYKGTYTFNITSDDGFRLYLTNGATQVASFLNWNESSPTPRTYQVTLAAGTTYAFRLEYYENGAGNGVISLGATAPPAPPPAPTGLYGTIVFNGIQLNWTASPTATYYSVYRAPSGGSYGSPTTVYGTTFTDTTCTPGTAYFYLVRPFNASDSNGSDAVLSPPITYPGPTAPSGLTAAPASGGISLQWNSLSGATRWYIYRAAAGSDYTFYTYTSTSQPAYLDTGTAPNTPATAPGTTYYYQVSGIDSSGNESGRSNPADAAFPYTYAGYVDGLSRDGLSGWAKDTRLPDQTLNVDIYDGVTLFQTVPAANLRSDSGIGYHGFLLATPTRLLDGQTHTVSFKYGGTTISLGGSPGVINPAAASTLNGYIDQADRSAVSG